jgi:hypothetical protein
MRCNKRYRCQVIQWTPTMMLCIIPFPNKTLDIDGRPRFAKLSIDNVEKVEIAAIDPDFIEAEASVPDGMR